MQCRDTRRMDDAFSPMLFREDSRYGKNKGKFYKFRGLKTKAKKTHTHFRTEANRAQYKYEKQGKNPYPRKNIAKFLKIPNFIHDIGNH